jgi:FKBP-type peptidyl-prolyl cis-trans isomerase
MFIFSKIILTYFSSLSNLAHCPRLNAEYNADMKKLTFAVFLIMFVSAAGAFAQAKRRTSTRRVTTTKKTVTTKKMTTPTIKQEAITTASGLTYIVTKHGDGAQLKAGDNVIVNYTGLLTNGQKFDSSLDAGQPFSFPLGAGRVIKGWDEGVQKLRVGDHATLIIPAAIAYGSRGAGDVIPPDATLVFLIEVIGVK